MAHETPPKRFSNSSDNTLNNNLLPRSHLTVRMDARYESHVSRDIWKMVYGTFKKKKKTKNVQKQQ